MLSYLAQTLLFQALFLGLYELALRRTTFFGWNRAYLLGSCLLSLLLPLVELEVLRVVTPSGTVLATVPAALVYLDGVELTARGAGIPGLNPWLFVWTAGAGLSLFLLGRKLLTLIRLYRQGERVTTPRYTLVCLPDNRDAFSFFRWVFLGSGHSEADAEIILRHEQIHIRQWHSLDLLLLELLRIPCWFNPLLWAYQRKLSEVHEFQADARAVQANKKEYYQQLLSQVFGVRDLSLVNPFFKHSSIKKRIVMIQKKSSRKSFKFLYLLSIPILALMVGISSCQDDKTSESLRNDSFSELSDKELIYELDLAVQKEEFERLEPLFKEATIRGLATYLDGSAEENVNAREAYKRAAQILEAKNRTDQTQSKLEKTIPFATIDQVPVFPGCEDSEDKRACFNEKIQRHIQKNFHYPEEAQQKGIEGRVSVMFTIDAEGYITDIKQKGPDPLLEEEVRRIISKLPRMQPGLQGEEAVNVPFAIPILFKLN